jgi:hypothetical protein
MPFIILIIFILLDFRPDLSNQWSLQILPMLHLLVKFSPSYSSIIFSSLALIPYLLVAEETLVSQTVGSSSPHHDPTPAAPRIQPSSTQPEILASPRNILVSPQPDIPESSIEPEKLPSPIRETRNDVSMSIHLFYFHPIDHH